MLHHPTLDQMHQLGLTGMAAAFQDLKQGEQDQPLSHSDWLAILLDREAAMRADKRLANRLRVAKLRYPQATIENIDFRSPRGLERSSFMALAEGSWLTKRNNVILCGPTGTGKSWLSCALGHQAARLDHSVLYCRVPRLFQDLAIARQDGRFPRLIDRLTKVQLLILDDWGTHRLTAAQRYDLLEITEERYQRRSTLIAAQVPIDKWFEVIDEPTIADAILDRIVHNAHRITLTGESMRKAQSELDQETLKPLTDNQS